MQEDEAVDGGEVMVMGFTIRCKGNNNEDEDVIVSDADAQVMSRNCEYFKNVFAHGTREAEERVILKPDWASSTAKQLVQLITAGKMSVQDQSFDRKSCYLLQEAAQQTLLNISLRVPPFVDESHRVGILNHAQTDLLFNVTEQLSGPKVEIKFPSSLSVGVGTGCKPISVDNWLTLLEQGLAIKKSDESSSFFQIVSETSPPPPDAAAAGGPASLHFDQFFFDLEMFSPSPREKEERHSYQLQAHSSTSSIGTMLNTMCQMLHQHRSVPDVRAYSKEEFSLRLPCGLALSLGLEKSIRHGFKVKVHRGSSLGYYLGGSNSLGCCPTIFGTLQQIQAFLSMIPEKMMQTYYKQPLTGNSTLKWCSLRVCAPSSDTLDRLVKAVGACKDNPNTLGVDVRSKAFFAVKSVSDMKLLLAAMIGGGGSVGEGDVVPTLVILEQPQGIF